MENEKNEILKSAVSRLLLWYPDNKKELPWRETVSPYGVFISESMLQQTRTAAVIPYYERFMKALPTLSDLAAVDDDTLMKLWQGLGYYSRARHLKEAAVILVRDFDGRFPKTAKELQKLPGIGEYTAGAIASIAFGEPSPAVDGNVLRVVTRLLTIPEDVLVPATKSHVTDLLRTVYPDGEAASLLTQAWMELGENVCIPNGKAHCTACPLSDICLANRGNLVPLFPYRSPKKPRKILDLTVFLLENDGKYAIRKRPEKGLLAGLYEFPNCVGALSPDDARRFLTEQGASPVLVTPIGNATHVFTHVEWHMTGYAVRLSAPGDFLFASKEEIKKTYAVPSAFRFFLEYLEKR